MAIIESPLFEIGSSNNLAAALNSEFLIPNQGGHAFIGVQVTIPTGGTIAFEGSWDGISYHSITLRSVTNDTNTTTATITDAYIGSIVGLKIIRFRTSIAGSTVGSVIGTLYSAPAVIETVEFGPAAHKFGYIPVHKAKEYTSAVTDDIIWTPAIGKKVVITDIIFTGVGTGNSILSVFDETNTANNWIYRGELDLVTNTPINETINLTTPFVSSTVNNNIRVTLSSSVSRLTLIIYGYEI